LKVFGPAAEWQFHVERAMLSLPLDEHEIPAPRLLNEGRLNDGYPYLFLSEIGGSTAEELWEMPPRFHQLEIARELGRITQAIHELPQEALHSIEQQFGGMMEHGKWARDKHVKVIKESHSVPLSQRQEMVRFIDEEAPDHLGKLKVVTHFELAHNHIYLARNAGSTVIKGIIDWVDARLGPAEADLSYLWFWTFSGDGEAMQECLATYFCTDSLPP